MVDGVSNSIYGGENKPMIAFQDVQVEWLVNLTKKKRKSNILEKDHA